MFRTTRCAVAGPRCPRRAVGAARSGQTDGTAWGRVSGGGEGADGAADGPRGPCRYSVRLAASFEMMGTGMGTAEPRSELHDPPTTEYLARGGGSSTGRRGAATDPARGGGTRDGGRRGAWRQIQRGEAGRGSGSSTGRRVATAAPAWRGGEARRSARGARGEARRGGSHLAAQVLTKERGDRGVKPR